MVRKKFEKPRLNLAANGKNRTFIEMSFWPTLEGHNFFILSPNESLFAAMILSHSPLQISFEG
ncbi:hypothetical protein LguiA_004550 [Lonicera macranthoides]